MRFAREQRLVGTRVHLGAETGLDIAASTAVFSLDIFGKPTCPVLCYFAQRRSNFDR
jgi:hypothetical protein